MIIGRNKFKALYIFIIIIVILNPFVFFYTNQYLFNILAIPNLTEIAEPDKNSKVLVIAPHNDDEVLSSGAFIKKTLNRGGKVKVILITNGDGYEENLELSSLKFNPKPIEYISLGYQRQQESILALESLGLSEKNVAFLGYPDRGISYLWSSFLLNTIPFTSKYTKRYSSPYVNNYTKDTLYTGKNLVFDLSKIIKEYRPNIIIYPHPNDAHPDHLAVNSFIKYTLTSLKYTSSKELLYIVHSGFWPSPMKLDTGLPLEPPEKLIGTGTHWLKFNIDNKLKKDKSIAMKFYKTQLKISKPFLLSFERKNELFGEYPILELKNNSSKDYIIKPCKTNKIIIDPIQDSLPLETNKSADIAAVYCEVSKEYNLHIFIECFSKISNLIEYNVDMIFMNGNKSFRFKLQTNDNTIKAITNTKDKSFSIKTIKTSYSQKVLHFIIPYKLSGKFKYIFMNATTSLKGNTFDNTAWRMLAQ